MALTSLCLSAPPKDFTFRLIRLPPLQPDVFWLAVVVVEVVEVVVVAVKTSLEATSVVVSDVGPKPAEQQAS